MTEAELQREINKELKDRGIKFLHLEKGRGKNKTHRAGFPDLMIFPSDSEVFFVELKTKKGVLSNDQIEFQSWCVLHNYFYSVIRSIETWNVYKKVMGLVK